MITIQNTGGLEWVIRDGISGRTIAYVAATARDYIATDVRVEMGLQMTHHQRLDDVREHFGVTHTIEEDRGQYRDSF
jgi:hypothetical protein